MAQREFSRKIYQKGKNKNKVVFVLKLLVFGFLFSVFGLLFLFIYYTRDLPRPEKFIERELAQSTKIFDRSGKILLYEIYGEEKRIWVGLEKIPNYLEKAVIATEDQNFYHHPGIDFRGIARATLVNLRLQRIAQGGSTIPQQLIRSSFLTQKRTLERKAQEIILALELSRRYSKDQILEWYLNQIPLGSNVYGVEAASQRFFRKSVSDLSLAEAATLAALIRAPSYLSPYGENKDKLLARKDYVLGRMVQENYLTSEEAELAKKEELKFAEILQPIKAPHFALYVRNYLIQRYGKERLKTEGLRVYTALDWELQKLAEEVVKKGAERNRKYGVYNAALVAISPKSGEVLSLVGSADWYATDPKPKGCQIQKSCRFEPKFDAASLAKRQPGSAFKPLVYATALAKGYTPETIVWDVETNFGVFAGVAYIPRNHDRRFRGPITFKDALAQSLNVPAVKVLYLAGLEESIETAKKMGITTLNKPASFYGLPLALGSGEVNLLEMTSAYGVFATEGLRIPPVFILKIVDAEGKIIEKNERIPQRVLEREISRQINSILSDNEARAPTFGHRSSLHFENHQVAVKTGTSQDYRDGWVIGYTNSIVVGVWAGNNDNSEPRIKRPSLRLVGPIWREFMETALLKHPQEESLLRAREF